MKYTFVVDGIWRKKTTESVVLNTWYKLTCT